MSEEHECRYVLQSYKCLVCGTDSCPYLSPDCEQGKHPAYPGDAWDHDADLPCECDCACHHGTRS